MASLGSNTFQNDYFLAEYGLHFLIMREREREREREVAYSF